MRNAHVFGSRPQWGPSSPWSHMTEDTLDLLKKNKIKQQRQHECERNISRLIITTIDNGNVGLVMSRKG